MNPFIKSLGSVVLVCAVGAVGGLGAAHGYLGLKSNYISGDYSAQREHAKEQVIVLGTSWCGYCAKTREFLRDRNVAFADIDVEQSPVAEQWLKDLGAEGVPLILIGDRQIRGYRPDAMQAAIASLGPNRFAVVSP